MSETIAKLLRDAELLNGLERLIRAKADAGERACVQLVAWYSGPGAPNGYAVYAGDDEPEMNEMSTLREAIWDALVDNDMLPAPLGGYGLNDADIARGGIDIDAVCADLDKRVV